MRAEPRPGFRITEITAFTVIGDDDEEGVCAFLDAATNVWVPMVAADISRLTQLREWAEIFRTAGTEVRERRFIQEEP
jgi:hypothetical protein